MAEEQQSEIDRKVETLEQLIAEQKWEDVNFEIMNPTNSEAVKAGGFNLVPLIGSFITNESKNELVDDCADVLQNLATVGNAKELAIAFLEQLSMLGAKFQLRLTLKPIQTVLLRLPKTRARLLTLVFDELEKHLQSLPVPRHHGLQGKEKLLMDLDPDVVEIEKMVEAMTGFCEPFVSKVSVFVSNESEVAQIEQQRLLVTSFLIKVCYRLTFVDLESEENVPKSTLRVVAERLVRCICELQSNIYNLCERNKREFWSGDAIPDYAIGTLLYLLHAEGIQKERIPCVYTHLYAFRVSLPMIVSLLRGGNEFGQQKAMLLCKHLLNFVRKCELRSESVDLQLVTDLASEFESVAVFSKDIALRKMAIQLVPSLVEKFDADGRQKFLLRLLTSSNHSGFRGLVIGIFKGYVNDALKQNDPKSWIFGSGFTKMIEAVFVLKDGVETDLLEEREHVLSALNFLRFLLLRDNAESNVTGIWNSLGTVKKEFLDPIVRGIEISRAHYVLELKHQTTKTLNNEKSTVSVERLPLPNLSQEQTKAALTSAITQFDLIHSVLARVIEITETK